MISKIKQYFSKKTFQEQGNKQQEKTGFTKAEIGFDNSNIYSRGDFRKYDPDRLKQNKGYSVYTEMLRDEQVKAVAEFKKHAIIARSWRFDVEKDEENNANEEQQKMADFFYAMIDQIKDSWSDNLLMILTALDYGYSICEKNYKTFMWEKKERWGIADIKLRPFETFDGGIQIDVHGNILKVEQLQGAVNVELPLDKIIYFVHQKNIDPHFGESDLRAAYRAYWAKDVTIKLHNLYLERMAGGFLYAEYEGNLSSDEKTALKALVNNVSGKMGAMLPKKVQLKLFPAVQTDVYEKAIAIHDKAIAKALLVPNLLGLTEQGTTGSYAQSEVHKEMFFYVINSIAKRLEEIINEQIIKQIALWNFNTEEFPRFVFDDLSNEQKEIIAQKWAELVSKGAVTKSDADEQHIRNLLNFPDKTEEEEEEEDNMNLPFMPGRGNQGVLPQQAPQPGQQQIPPQQQQKNEPQQVKKKFSERPWLKRVDFGAYKKSIEEQENKFGRQMADVMGQIRDSLFKQIRLIVGSRSMGNVKIGEFKALQIPKKLEIGLKTIMKNNLQDVVEFNYEEARKELPVQFKEKLIGPGMDTTQIARFLREKSDFFITGVLEKDVLSQVLQSLQNGIKYDKSISEMMRDINGDTKLLAVLPETDKIGRAVNVPARIENIVRTNIADGMNLARTNMFNREEYKGFIEAFEYSAVMDDRTTEICDTLNGRIRKDWGSYTPPNHYQCRSILVPVTILDEWDGKESAIPSMTKPQDGFI